jgi:hypothetical protein
MAGFIKKVLPWALGGAGGGYLYNQHRKQRSKKNRREKNFYKAQKKYEKKYESNLKKDRKDQQTYEKKYAKSEKGANSKLQEFLNKYGDESFTKHNALNRGQRGLLDQLTRSSQQGIRNQRTPDDISDIREDPNYQAAGNTIQDMLSPNSQAYQAYENSALQDFNQKILPSIANKYAGQGAGGLSSSGYQNELKESGNDLTTRLRALRAGIQQNAIPLAQQHAQLPLGNETAQIQNLLAQNQQAQQGAKIGLETNPYTNVYRAPTFSQGIISGGPAPVPRVPGFAPQGPRQTAPSVLSQLGANVLPSVGAAAGTAFGAPLGGAAGAGLAGLFK